MGRQRERLTLLAVMPSVAGIAGTVVGGRVDGE